MTQPETHFRTGEDVYFIRVDSKSRAMLCKGTVLSTTISPRCPGQDYIEVGENYWPDSAPKPMGLYAVPYCNLVKLEALRAPGPT